jgi:hypothetical protein
MDSNIIIFLAGQAIVITGALIGTYVRLAVKLERLSLLVANSDRTSQSNHDDIILLKADVSNIRVKIEHIETMQSMLCSTCPLKGNHHQTLSDTRAKK